jgi:hypothetical protein
MPASVDYRQRAEDCIRLAAANQDPVEKAMLLQLAEQWTRLADHKAKRERVNSSKSN